MRLFQRTELALPSGFVDADVSRQIVNGLGSFDTLHSLTELSIPQSSVPYWLTMQAAQAAKEPEPEKDKALRCHRFSMA